MGDPSLARQKGHHRLVQGPRDRGAGVLAAGARDEGRRANLDRTEQEVRQELEPDLGEVELADGE